MLIEESTLLHKLLLKVVHQVQGVEMKVLVIHEDDDDIWLAVPFGWDRRRRQQTEDGEGDEQCDMIKRRRHVGVV